MSSSRKISLTDLVEPVAPPVVLNAPIPEQSPGEPAAQQRSVPTEAVTSRPRRQSSPSVNDRFGSPAVGEWRRYDQYERKETRLREDQYNRLSEVSRRLNKARKGTGERITENTLIRIAIDLLLANEAQLSGISEAELRATIGL